MRINLPYMYHATGKIEGTRRRLDKVIARDFLSVDIPEVTGVEAPVCIQFFHESEHYDSYSFHVDHVDENYSVDVRLLDEKFYRPWRTKKVWRDASALEKGEWINYDDEVKRAYYEGAIDSMISVSDLDDAVKAYDQGLKTYDLPNMIGEVLSDKEDMMRVASAVAGRFVIIDGQLWERCPEPVLVLLEEVADKTLTISPGFPDTYPSYFKNIIPRFIFAIDEIEEALEFAEARREELGDARRIETTTRIVTHGDHFVNRDVIYKEINRLVGKAIETGGAVQLNKVDGSYVRLWNDMKDKLFSAKGSNDPDDYMEVVQAWVEFQRERDAYEPRGLEKGEGSLKTAEAMLERFERFQSRLEIAGPTLTLPSGLRR